jgi:hypothetical protein
MLRASNHVLAGVDVLMHATRLAIFSDAYTDKELDAIRVLIDMDIESWLSPASECAGWGMAREAGRLAFLVLFASVTGAGSAQLTEPIKIASFDSVIRGFTADSKHVIATADRDADGGDELFRVSVDGSEPLEKLSSSVPEDRRGVRFPAMSPNGAYVAYLHDVNEIGSNELWIVATDGSMPATRIATFVGTDYSSWGTSFPAIQFTPDSGRIVFRGRIAPDGTDNLWTAAIATATTITRLSWTGVAHGRIRDFLVSPGGTGIVFESEEMSGAVPYGVLWGRAFAEGSPVRLSGQGAVAGEASASLAMFVPGTADLVFVAFTRSPLSTSVWRSSIVGGLPVRFGLEPGTVISQFCAISQDGAILFLRGGTTANFFSSLFAANLETSEAVKAFETPGSTGFVECGKLTKRAPLYFEFVACPQGTTAPCNLHQSTRTGSSVAQVLTGVRDGRASSSQLRGDPIESSAIRIQEVSGSNNELFELRAMDRATGLSWPLLTARNPARYFGGFPEFPTNSVKVTDHQAVFVSSHDDEDATTKSLWATDRSGGVSRKLTGALPAGQGVKTPVDPASFARPSFWVSPDGRWALFVANKEQPDTYETWSARLLPDILNIDRNQDRPTVDALSDGLYIMRYMFGADSDVQFGGDFRSTATRTKLQAVAHLRSIAHKLDVDGDGDVLYSSDGLLIVRRLLGFAGEALVSGLPNLLSSPELIQTRIDALLDLSEVTPLKSPTP